MTIKPFNYIKNLSLIVCFLALFSACSERGLEEVPVPNTGKDGYVKIEFTTPDLKQSIANTRAMNEAAESDIDVDNLSILVFNDDKTKTLNYIAPIVKNSIQKENNKTTITVKLTKTKDQMQVVAIANHNLSNDLIEGQTTLDQFLKSLEFNMPIGNGNNNIWNTSETDYKRIPMYGKISVDGISETNKTLNIKLFRALARIDVGLNFELSPDGSKGPYTEVGKGLNNFDLKEVYVFRTYEKGYIAPSKTDFGATPSVPEGAKRRGHDEPLIYQVDDNSADAFVREIYLPEADKTESLSNTEVNNEIHTIVIGGSFEGGPTTFYRLDFAQDATDNTRNFLPILRNHRYVFNILSVRSPGFTSYEKALKSTPTTNLDYELVEWDETIHETHVNGKHYFGLDNREITFGAVRPKDSGDDEEENSISLKYQTNFPLTQEQPMILEWENPEDPAMPSTSSNFKAEWLPNQKKIKITRRNSNETNKLISEVLHAKFGTFDIKVNVNQDYIIFEYLLNCETVMVEGSYLVNQTLGSTHKINLSITTDKNYMVGRTYRISTPKVNGIYFESTGTINKVGVQNITLQGHGKLRASEDGSDQSAYIDPFTIQINSNSSSGSFCEATITPIQKMVTILTMGVNTGYGYNLSDELASRKVLESPRKFGPNDNSIVKTLGFDIIDGGNSFSSNLDYIRPGGKNGKHADILHFGYTDYIDSNEIPLVLEFLKNGGVLLYFTEFYGTNNTVKFIEQIMGINNVRTEFKVNNKCYPMMGHTAILGAQDSPGWTAGIEELRKDPILNGPFGDLTDKQWGADVGGTNILFGLPKDLKGLTIHSPGQHLEGNNLDSSDKGSVSSFRYQTEDYNFVYNGDGGFTSQSSAPDKGNWTSSTICPFIYDGTTLEPIPKPGFGTHRQDAYNSQYFCNMMAWAIDRANSAELQQKKANYRKNK